MKRIIACDLGTSGIKASLFDKEGNINESTFEQYTTYYRDSNISEQKPSDWWCCIIKSIKNLINKSNLIIKEVECIAVTGHSLGVIPIDKYGELLREKVPIWSDSRAKKQALNFFKNYDYKKWYYTTGNGFPPELYPAFKMLWYEENEPETYQKAMKFLGTKDYINYKLTGKFYTDYSYASGTGLYNLYNWKYDDELISAFKIDKNKLPKIVSSKEIIGSITKVAAEQVGLKSGIPVVCGGVDNSCMALGALCYKENRTYTSLGSSAWIAVSSHKPLLSLTSKPFVFAHVLNDQFVSAVPIFSAGASFNWIGENFFKNYKEKEKLDMASLFGLMTSLAEISPVGSNKLIFNPSLAGGSSMDKSVNIKGAFMGLTLNHSINDIVRSAMEGIAMNLRVVLDKLEEITPVSDDMVLVGGGSKNNLWRKIFADIYNKNIIKTNIDQTATSFGAAALAAVGIGIWDTFEKIDTIIKLEEINKPIKKNNEKYEKILPIFKNIGEVLSDIGDKLQSLDFD